MPGPRSTTSASAPAVPSRIRRDATIARRLLGISLTLVVAALLAVIWRWKGRPQWDRWQQQKEFARAESAFAAGNFAGAATHAERVVRGQGDHLPAVILLAKVHEQQQSREAVRWFRRVAELQKMEPTAVTRWAYSALQHGDLPSAYAALRAFPKGADTASYHEIAGRVALARDDRADAGRHFARALELAPGEAEYQLQFALTQLPDGEPSAAARARSLLTGLLNDPVRRLPALSALTKAALHQGDTVAALDWDRRLQGQTNLTFADSLVHLSVLRATKSPDFPAVMAGLQQQAAGTSEKLLTWLTWQQAEGFAADALRWFQTLPPETQNVAPVMAQAAELYVATSNWTGLRQWVFNAHWAELESHRFAYQALATLRLTPRIGATAAANLWQDALTATRANPLQLGWLAAKAESWGLARAAETTLWQMVEHDLDTDATLGRLARLYRSLRETDGIYRVAGRQLERQPDSLAVQSEVVYLAALQKVDLARRRPLANRVEAHAGGDPRYTQSVALYLSRTGEPARALELLRQLPAEALKDPARAAIMIYVCALVGDRATVRDLLAQSVTTGLLPEEVRLIEEARVRVRAQ